MGSPSSSNNGQFNSPLNQQPWERNAGQPNNPDNIGYTQTTWSQNNGGQGVTTSTASAPPANTTSPKVELWNKNLVPQQEGSLVGASGKGSNDFSSGKASIGVGYGKVAISSRGNVDLKALSASLTAVKLDAKISEVNAQASGQFGVGAFFGWVHDKLFGKSPGPPFSVPAGAAPLAARVTDMTSHGSPLFPGIGSLNVLIGGLPAWRTVIDLQICATDKTPGKVLVGSPKVLINKMMACRVGDVVVELAGPNQIAKGCPTVKIGLPAPALPPAPKGQDVVLDASGTGDLLTAQASAELSAKIDLLNPTNRQAVLTAKAGAVAAVARAQGSAGISIPIPFTGHSIRIGVQGEASALSIGAGAEASGGWSQQNGAFVQVGAKAALGVGAGANLLIGFK